MGKSSRGIADFRLSIEKWIGYVGPPYLDAPCFQSIIGNRQSKILCQARSVFINGVLQNLAQRGKESAVDRLHELP